MNNLESKKINNIVSTSRAIGLLFLIIAILNILLWSYVLISGGINDFDGYKIFVRFITIIIIFSIGFWLIFLSKRISFYQTNKSRAIKSNQSIFMLSIIMLILSIVELTVSPLALGSIVLFSILIFQSQKTKIILKK